MSYTVCIAPAKTLAYPKGGGHFWAYLNWALGLRAIGCKVIWLELVSTDISAEEIQSNIAVLKTRLEGYGFGGCLALYAPSEAVEPKATTGCLSLDDAAEADLLIELRYDTPFEIVRRFRRSALVDLDPGLLQLWMANQQVCVAPHDVYFTIGEGVALGRAMVPNVGIRWNYTSPCVALDWWPLRRAADEAPFTSVMHWYANGWLLNDVREDDKRTAFRPFLCMPQRTSQPLELALDLTNEDEQRSVLKAYGWRVADAHEIAATPWGYQRYIQESLGEFGCAKPSYVWLDTAWVSDRTICYLASGKPAVVQHTGNSRFLPDSAGLFRFRNADDAASAIEQVAADYDHQCHLARALAEEYFDARKVVASVLERAE